MIGLIFVVVVLVASIVLAIFASRVWHWAHVLVVMGLVFSTIGYSNLAFRVLSIRAKHQDAERKALQRLAQQEKLINAIDRGTEDPTLVSRLAEPLGLGQDAQSITSIGDLEHELRMVNRVRGRLWDNVRPLGEPDKATLRVEVGVADDAPAMNISPGAILYAFEQGDPSQGAAYIGEFRVVQAAPRRLQLEPVLMMSPERLDRYFDSAADGRLWTLHESMPVDTHELFAGLSEEQLRAILPQSSVEEYLRDGAPTRPDDDPRRILGIDEDGRLLGPEQLNEAQKKIYSRQLRDYAYLFQFYAQRQTELRAEGRMILSNKQKLDEALAGAKQIGAFRREENSKLKQDLQRVTNDLKTVEGHLAAVQTQAKRAQQLLVSTLAANLQTADKLAALQAAAIERADLSTTPVPARAAGDPHAL